MGPIKKFELERKANIKLLGSDKKLKGLALKFLQESTKKRYPYNFDWLGRPIIQCPQDIVAMQEILWKVKPDLVIETGIAHGGSLIFYASILELIGKGEILGIDIDIRKHNRKKIIKHKMYKRITMLEGSSTDAGIFQQVKKVANGKNKIIVCLDSSHTRDHVYRELELYSPLVSRGSYLVVFDTITEFLPSVVYANRPWGKGNNPKTAVDEFLRRNKNFIIDRDIENKLLITFAPGGYLKRVR